MSVAVRVRASDEEAMASVTVERSLVDGVIALLYPALPCPG